MDAIDTMEQAFKVDISWIDVAGDYTFRISISFNFHGPDAIATMLVSKLPLSYKYN